MYTPHSITVVNHNLFLNECACVRAYFDSRVAKICAKSYDCMVYTCVYTYAMKNFIHHFNNASCYSANRYCYINHLLPFNGYEICLFLTMN